MKNPEIQHANPSEPSPPTAQTDHPPADRDTKQERSSSLHARALAAYGASRYEQACELASQATLADPFNPVIYNTLGLALEASGDLQTAIAAYKRAVRLDPTYAHAHCNIAVASNKSSNYAQAVESAASALQHAPDLYQAFHALAYARYNLGDYTEAETACRNTIRLKPDFAEAYNHLGLILTALDRLPEALQALNTATRIDPRYAEAFNNLGMVQSRMNRIDASFESYRRALALDPHFTQAHYNLANILARGNWITEAVQHYQRAIAIDPEFAAAHFNLANTLKDNARIDDAIRSYEKAVRRMPENPEARWNLSLALLTAGRLREGWAHHHYRHLARLGVAKYPHNYEKPAWRGEPFPDKTLLVHYEQGLGDSLQFVRYLPMVKRKGGTIVLEIQPPVFPLVASWPCIDTCIEARTDQKPEIDFDLVTSLVDLPGIFDTTLQTIPARAPYISPLSGYEPSWLPEPDPSTLTVGISWAGSPDFVREHDRSCPLEFFLALQELPKVRLCSLQVGPAAAQLENHPEVIDLGANFKDFADTAAAVQSLDLVISIDTCIVHLAGAMAKPVWVVLCRVPAWRFMLDRPDSPWYPTMRLFRQRDAGDWAPVFAEVEQEIKKLLAQR